MGKVKEEKKVGTKETDKENAREIEIEVSEEDHFCPHKFASHWECENFTPI